MIDLGPCILPPSPPSLCLTLALCIRPSFLSSFIHTTNFSCSPSSLSLTVLHDTPTRSSDLIHHLLALVLDAIAATTLDHYYCYCYYYPSVSISSCNYRTAATPSPHRRPQYSADPVGPFLDSTAGVLTSTPRTRTRSIPICHIGSQQLEPTRPFIPLT